MNFFKYAFISSLIISSLIAISLKLPFVLLFILCGLGKYKFIVYGLCAGLITYIMLIGKEQKAPSAKAKNPVFICFAGLTSLIFICFPLPYLLASLSCLAVFSCDVKNLPSFSEIYSSVNKILSG